MPPEKRKKEGKKSERRVEAANQTSETDILHLEVNEPCCQWLVLVLAGQSREQKNCLTSFKTCFFGKIPEGANMQSTNK